MKPRVAIFGWPGCYPIIHDPALCEASPYLFDFLGGCVDFMQYRLDQIRGLRRAYAAVILHSVGAPPTWEVAKKAIKLEGDVAKVALWSMDVHVPGAVEKEGPCVPSFDGYFIAHSEWIPRMEGFPQWMPCYLPRTARYNITTLEIPRTLDLAFVGEPYVERDKVIKRVSEFMLDLGRPHFFGTVLKDDIPGLYLSARAVFNVNQNSDLNIRQFEALAAGRPVLMTPAHDWHHPMFEDLWPYAVEIPRYPTRDEFEAGLKKVLAIDARPARDIILAKHDLVHRYQAIADYLLI